MPDKAGLLRGRQGRSELLKVILVYRHESDVLCCVVVYQ